MGDVIVGMPGPWANDYSEASDHYTTKIGGLPDWPIPNMVVRPHLLKCSSCGGNLCLVAQIYAPISCEILTTEERLIYIFGCVTQECGSTIWRALRVQKSINGKESNTLGHEVVPLPDPSSSPFNSDLREDLWKFDSEAEKDDELDLEELGRALTEASSLASHRNKKNTNLHYEANKKSLPISQTARMVHNNIPVLPCFYIYTREETLSRAVDSARSLSMKENQSDVDDPAPEEIWEAESYEYDRALNADRTYLKFKKRMDVHPEQCFRYSYGGKPLLATGEAGDPGRCMHCGGSRHYELQLMPPLLYFLHEATHNSILENWNWTSLMVYTCSKGCSNSSSQEEFNEGWVVAEEAVVVQHE